MKVLSIIDFCFIRVNQSSSRRRGAEPEFVTRLVVGGGKGCMAINHITGLLLEWGVDVDRSIRAAQWSKRCSRHSSRFPNVIYSLYMRKVSFIILASFIRGRV